MPPELNEALEQISEIRGHLVTTESFRGYRALPAAATGMVALLTALAQPALVGDAAVQPVRYVMLWVGAAVLCAAGVGAQMLDGYLHCASAHRRATTRIVVGQLLPSLTAGALLTWTLTWHRPELVELLPGLWVMLVSLGVFASRRHLPRTIGWVGLYYLACAAAILYYLPGREALAPWVMGTAFGVGQFGAALVLYWNLERNGTEKEKV